MKRFKMFTLLAFLVLLGACATRSGVDRSVLADALPAPDTTNAIGAYEGDSEYRIGAQDLVQITVFNVPDLSRDVRVNSNGQISLPLIGGVLAGGKTIPELEYDIATRLAETYLQEPQVTVFVKEYTSQRVTMQGAFNQPGIYPLTGKTSLLQAVAMARGLDPLAQSDAVVIFREVDSKRMAAVFDLKQISSGAAEDPRVYGDDIIVVERSGTRSSLQDLIKSSPLLALFFLL
ncbi:polysaccharide biosynthesis/export family protein [Denitratimonas sp. CY0512]|uniref:polysaccharide biosynthesis/export family protein n=1 Tax=Denitratimonas sp. CY0512 TaxID=3131940 RepID=UPI00309BEDF9